MIKLFQKYATFQKHTNHVVTGDFSDISIVRYQQPIYDVADSPLCLNNIHDQNECPQLGKVNMKLTKEIKVFSKCSQGIGFFSHSFSR